MALEFWPLEAWHWLALGLLLVLAEVLIPATVLLWTGVAALILGAIMVAVPGLSLHTQLLVFAALAAVSVASGLALRRKMKQKPQSNNINVGSARLVGQRAALVKGIVNGRGEAQLGDTVWPVTGPELPTGASVIVTGSDGVKLTVAPAYGQWSATAP